MRDKYFYIKINFKVFLKLAVSYLLIIARYTQSTQNSKFVISLQYPKKERRDEVDFLHADKHQTFLQLDSIDLDGHSQACPNYPKQQVCKIFDISQK